MTLLETILHHLSKETSTSYISEHCFPEEDLKLLKEENLQKIPAIHACLDDDMLWVSEDLDETDDSYECYDLITINYKDHLINIYLYNLTED